MEPDAPLQERLTKKALMIRLGAAQGIKAVNPATVDSLIREGLPFVRSLSGKRKEFLWSQVTNWLAHRDASAPAPVRMRRSA